MSAVIDLSTRTPVPDHAQRAQRQAIAIATRNADEQRRYKALRDLICRNRARRGDNDFPRGAA